jgi:PIN domain nuclease of toxin-antitoxin system
VTRLLLDTHALLWFAAGDPRLGRSARRALERKDAEVYLSAASVWEMAIKASLGRLTLPAPVGEYVRAKAASGLRLLPIGTEHAAAVEALPLHHRDPFDRLLASQARAERLTLVTADPIFRRYGVKTVW